MEFVCFNHYFRLLFELVSVFLVLNFHKFLVYTKDVHLLLCSEVCQRFSENPFVESDLFACSLLSFNVDKHNSVLLK